MVWQWPSPEMSPILADGVQLLAPKLSPEIVIDCEFAGTVGVFVIDKYETDGASNVKPAPEVPTCAPTVSANGYRPSTAERSGGSHETVVPDVHDVVVQESSPVTEAVAVCSVAEPKLSPEIVTEYELLSGRFPEAPTDERVGASNPNPEMSLVPTTADTVTDAYIFASWFELLSAHSNPVAEVHDVVAQSLASVTSAEVGEKTYEPKLSPLIVTVEPPDGGPFCVAEEIAGASNVMSKTRVPTTAETVTLAYAVARTVGTLIAQLRLVPDDHDAELH